MLSGPNKAWCKKHGVFSRNNRIQHSKLIWTTNGRRWNLGQGIIKQQWRKILHCGITKRQKFEIGWRSSWFKNAYLLTTLTINDRLHSFKILSNHDIVMWIVLPLDTIVLKCEKLQKKWNDFRISCSRNWSKFNLWCLDNSSRFTGCVPLCYRSFG